MMFSTKRLIGEQVGFGELVLFNESVSCLLQIYNNLIIIKQKKKILLLSASNIRGRKCLNDLTYDSNMDLPIRMLVSRVSVCQLMHHIQPEADSLSLLLLTFEMS